MPGGKNERQFPAIQPVCLAIHLTYQCPLTCAHCCFSSDMYQKDALSADTIIQLIDEAVRLPTINAVGFTGGDPFLHPETLEAGLRHASDLGLETRVVTSGYWAINPDKAKARLRPLVDAGLDELCISYDESHLAYVKEQSLLNAYRSAEHFGIKTTIYMSTDAGDRVDQRYVREKLGVLQPQDNPRLLIIESQVTSTGRAVETASPEKRKSRAERPKTYLGPCPSMLRQPAVTPTGDILPCCGTIPLREGLRIGSIHETSIDKAMNGAFRNDLYKWIALEGPVAVLKAATAKTTHPLCDGDFDGICHACDVLFSSPEYMALAEQAAEDIVDSLAIQEAVLAAAGRFYSSQDRV